MMQPAMYWPASDGVMNAAKTKRKNAQASSAMEKGFTNQLMNSVTRSPAGRRPTFFNDEKSTLIIIGVIMSQISTAIGALIWLPLPNSIPRRPATAPGRSFPRPMPAAMQNAKYSVRLTVKKDNRILYRSEWTEIAVE